MNKKEIEPSFTAKFTVLETESHGLYTKVKCEYKYGSLMLEKYYYVDPNEKDKIAKAEDLYLRDRISTKINKYSYNLVKKAGALKYL